MPEPLPKKKVTTDAVWREARDLIGAHRGRLYFGLVVMLINSAAGLVAPAETKVVIDKVFPANDMHRLTMIALTILGATVVQAVTSFGLSQVLGVAGQRAITEMRRAIQAHLVRLPIGRFDSTQTGQLVSRVMTDAEGIRNLIGTGLVQLIGGAITAIVAFGILIYLDWRLTLCNVVILGLFAGGMAYAFSKLRPIFRTRGQINADVTGRLVESISGIRVVKAYAAERREKLVFTRGVNKLFRNVATTMTAISGTMALSTVIVGLTVTLLFIVGGHEHAARRITVGGLFAYSAFLLILARPLIQMASVGTQVSEAFAGLDRIRELRSWVPEDADDAERGAAGTIVGHVQFDDVTFSYNPGVPVLKHIAFDAPAGSTTALVGPSGSGKSTLVSLVMAFNHPDSGRILIDGRDLAGIRLREYRSRLGIVLQDNFLFDGSILENIRFAHPSATDADVLEAARVAHCDEFALRFELGYQTIVGERGVKLSGGQRQRVAIARAILADPAILILDEATSSLDSESESLIQEGLARLRAGRTTFVIAHRLSTITSADQILVLEDGEIVERGTHDELLDQGGRYRALYERQYRQALDRYVNPGEELAGAQHIRP
ncbi:MAG: ABC transporter ATP-binding protein [Gemmatimonadales bacterium]